VIGISPGAAYGDAKRWLPERFAECARQLAASSQASVLVFGAAAERALCETVAEPLRRAGIDVRNLAGETSLREFIDLAAACRLFLTNDSGAMHVASALGVPTVAVFGATDDTATGPTGPSARVVREHAECSPCLLRECPIDHRCMTRVEVARVTAAASLLLDITHEHKWTQETKS
jgi:heptosyltransferase-2